MNLVILFLPLSSKCLTSSLFSFNYDDILMVKEKNYQELRVNCGIFYINISYLHFIILQRWLRTPTISDMPCECIRALRHMTHVLFRVILIISYQNMSNNMFCVYVFMYILRISYVCVCVDISVILVFLLLMRKSTVRRSNFVLGVCPLFFFSFWWIWWTCCPLLFRKQICWHAL